MEKNHNFIGLNECMGLTSVIILWLELQNGRLDLIIFPDLIILLAIKLQYWTFEI